MYNLTNLGLLYFRPLGLEVLVLHRQTFLFPEQHSSPDPEVLALRHRRQLGLAEALEEHRYQVLALQVHLVGGTFLKIEFIDAMEKFIKVCQACYARFFTA